MPHRLFDIPFIYRNTGTPPRKRSERSFLASATASFSVPDAGVAELEPALLFVIDTNDGGSKSTTKVNVKQCRGMLVRPIRNPVSYGMGRNVDAAGLVEMAAKGDPRLMPEIFHPPATYYGLGQEVFPRHTLAPARITEDGYEAAVSAIQRRINDEAVLIEGKLYGRVHDPAWTFRMGGGGPWSTEFALKPGTSFTLPAHRLDLVEEMAAWSREKHGVEFHIPRDIQVEAMATHIPYRDNPVIRNAAVLAERVLKGVRSQSDAMFDLIDLAATVTKKEARVTDALAFASAVGELANDPDIPPLSSQANNAQWAEFYWKFYEILPEGYKVDPEDETMSLLGGFTR